MSLLTCQGAELFVKLLTWRKRVGGGGKGHVLISKIRLLCV